jgi:hypothetical protein
MPDEYLDGLEPSDRAAMWARFLETPQQDQRRAGPRGCRSLWWWWWCSEQAMARLGRGRLLLMLNALSAPLLADRAPLHVTSSA